MATAYPTLTRPPSSISWGLKDNTEVHTSPFNGTVQTLQRLGTRWFASVVYEELEMEDASALEVFFAGLEGRAGRFDLPDFSRLLPRGVETTIPTLSVAAVPGDSELISTGWTPSTSLLLVPADRIRVGDNYVMTLTEVVGDASGNATVSIKPPITISAPIGTPLILVNPSCRMMIDKSSIDWDIRPPVLTSLRFSCMESHT